MIDEARTGVGDVYDEHYDLLFRVACKKFKVPPQDIPVLIHDVMISYIMACHEVNDPERWLVAAICNASRYYHRRNRREREQTTELHDDHHREGAPEERLIRRLDVSRFLDRVPQRHRRVLHWHYVDGYTALEIARLLNTTPRYAERLIHKALRSASNATRMVDDPLH